MYLTIQYKVFTYNEGVVDWALYQPEFYDYHEEYIEPSLKDIIKFLFKQKYDKNYDDLDWYLEQGAREFVKNIEDLYAKNMIGNANWILQNKVKLIEFLKEEYKSRVQSAFEREIFDEYGDSFTVEVE